MQAYTFDVVTLYQRMEETVYAKSFDEAYSLVRQLNPRSNFTYVLKSVSDL